MDKQFYELLHKYLNGKATEEEQQFVIKYYNLFESEPDIIALLSNEKKEELKNEINASIWKNINNNSAPPEKIVTLKTKVISIAAAAIVIMVCSISLLFLHTRKDEKKVFSSSVPREKQNRFLTLPDGSTVILRPGSKLDYASSFEAFTKREVYLQGEAFFDIRHNNLKPFVVHTGKLETTVLGTAFDVKALSGDKTITVTVTRGRVKVSSQDRILGIIKPNEQIVYNNQESNSIQNKVNSKIAVEWTDQDLLFEDVTVAEAAKVLEERFKVKISFSDQLVRSKHFTTTFDKNQNLENVLQSICEFNDAMYRYDTKKATVTISSKFKTN